MGKYKKFDIGPGFPPGPILTSINQIKRKNIREEKVIAFTGAKVIYANYELILHDFPQLKKEKIDDWLIRNASFISESQARQTKVNSPIPLTRKKIRAWRPPRYGRALVFSLEENRQATKEKRRGSSKYKNRLIDIKGVGVAPNRTPNLDPHSTGLMYLDNALVEVLNQHIIQKIFEHSGSAFGTVPIYGVLDAGFNIRLNELEEPTTPAGILVRRAQTRPNNPGGLPAYGSADQKIQIAIELLLRKYGISSVNNGTTIRVWKEEGELKVKYGNQVIDFLNKKQRSIIEKVSHYKDGMEQLNFHGINVQHTGEVKRNPLRTQLVDFGTYRVFKSFKDPILSLVKDKLLRWGGSIWPDSDRFVQPDPSCRVSYEMWGGFGEIWGFVSEKKNKKMDVLCEGLANGFRDKSLSKEGVFELLNNYLNEAVKDWKNL